MSTRTTTVQPFTPTGGSSAESRGDHGTRRTYGRRPAGSERGIRARGDTGVKSRKVEQTPGLQWVSRKQVRPRTDCARDQQSLKPLLEGLQIRTIRPIRRRRRNKVHPLNTNGSTWTRHLSPSTIDSAHYKFLAPSAAKTALKRSKLFVVGKSCRPNVERMSSCPPAKDEYSSLSPVPEEANLSFKSRMKLRFASPRRPWTTRLCALIVPQHRGTTALVVPFETSQGLVSGLPESLGEQSDRGYRGKDSKALMIKRDTKGVGEKEMLPALAKTVYHRQGSAAMIFRPASCIDPLPIPGVPHFDCECQTGPDDGLTSEQRQGTMSFLVSCSGHLGPSPISRDKVLSLHLSNLPPPSSQEQEANVTDGDNTSIDGGRSSKSVSSPSFTLKDAVASSSEGEDETPDDGGAMLRTAASPFPPKSDSSFALAVPSLPPSLSTKKQEVKEDEDRVVNDQESFSNPMPLSSSASSSVATLQEAVRADGDGTPDHESSLPKLVPSPTKRNGTALSLPSPLSSYTSHVGVRDDGDQASDKGGSVQLASPSSVSIKDVLPFSSSPVSTPQKHETGKNDGGRASHDKGPPFTPVSPFSPYSRNMSSCSVCCSSSPTHDREDMPTEDRTPTDGEIVSRPTSSKLTSPTSRTDDSYLSACLPSTLPSSSSQDEDAVKEAGDGESISDRETTSSPSGNDTASCFSFSSLSSSQIQTAARSGEDMPPKPDPEEVEIIKVTKSLELTSLEESRPRQSGKQSFDHLSDRTPNNENIGLDGKGQMASNAAKTANASGRRKSTKFPTFRQQNLAVKMNVDFVMLRSSLADLSHWLAVVLSCIARRKDLRRMLFASKYVVPYTKKEIKEIESNERKAREILLQLKKMASLSMSDATLPAGNSQTSPLKAPKESTFKTLVKDKAAAVSQGQRIVPSGRQGTSAENPESSKTRLFMGDSPKRLKNVARTTARSQENIPGLRQETSTENSQFSNPKQPQNASVNTSQSKLPPMNTHDTVLHFTSYPTIDAGDLEYLASKSGDRVVLGRGNFGEVLLMRRRGDSTLLAVKRMTKDYFLMRYEVAAMHAVSDCPFFPKFVGVIDHSSYAQEMIGGVGANAAHDFHKARRYDLLTAREWLRVCRDVTEGMKALHDAGWTHNDLHCGNAMVCPSPTGSEVAWTGKIIDLGNAQQIKNPRPPVILNEDQQKVLYRFAKQCAPEVLEGKASFSVKSDVYSLGKLFVDVAGGDSSLHGLGLLGEFSCMRRNPCARPTLDTVRQKLDDLLSKMAETEQPSSLAPPAFPRPRPPLLPQLPLSPPFPPLHP